MNWIEFANYGQMHLGIEITDNMNPGYVTLEEERDRKRERDNKEIKIRTLLFSCRASNIVPLNACLSSARRSPAGSPLV